MASGESATRLRHVTTNPARRVFTAPPAPSAPHLVLPLRAAHRGRPCPAARHDRDPGSPTYGNYRWYWREPKPNDRNAVEFSLQSASLTWAAFHDRLPESTRTALEGALALGAEGLLRHRVDVSYTNIFLMRIANCALIGDALDLPDLKEHAAQWFDEWFRYTRSNGIHEFSSPTYYGTDLGGIARFSQSEPLRRRAQAALQLVGSDIAANWFAPFAGAHSRDYGFLTGHGYLNQQLLRAGWLAGGGRRLRIARGHRRPHLPAATGGRAPIRN